jgi:uncharacterized coiled-coil protein SlyX
MDGEVVSMVKDIVSDCVFEFQLKMTELLDKIASLERKLNSLEATAGGAAATKEPASEFQGRLSSLEATTAATSKGLEELRASRAKAPTAGSQTPATCYDIRQLEVKIGALASEVALAKRATDHEPRGQAILQKFGDVEAAQNALEVAQAALREQVGTMEVQLDHTRIGSAMFALNAIGLKESDRRVCLDRLKGEEERLKQGTTGPDATGPDAPQAGHDRTMAGGQTWPSTRSTRSAVPLLSLKHENRFKLLWRRSTL